MAGSNKSTRHLSLCQSHFADYFSFAIEYKHKVRKWISCFAFLTLLTPSIYQLHLTHKRIHVVVTNMLFQCINICIPFVHGFSGKLNRQTVDKTIGNLIIYWWWSINGTSLSPTSRLEVKRLDVRLCLSVNLLPLLRCYWFLAWFLNLL